VPGEGLVGPEAEEGGHEHLVGVRVVGVDSPQADVVDMDLVGCLESWENFPFKKGLSWFAETPW
jgi:hypothetical protein